MSDPELTALLALIFCITICFLTYNWRSQVMSTSTSPVTAALTLLATAISDAVHGLKDLASKVASGTLDPQAVADQITAMAVTLEQGVAASGETVSAAPGTTSTTPPPAA